MNLVSGSFQLGFDLGDQVMPGSSAGRWIEADQDLACVGGRWQPVAAIHAAVSL
jgi:hypothetical protein